MIFRDRHTNRHFIITYISSFLWSSLSSHHRHHYDHTLYWTKICGSRFIAWFRVQPKSIFIWQYWWSLCVLCPDRKTLVNTSLSATTFDSTIPRESLWSSWDCMPCNPKQSIGKSVHVYLKYTYYNQGTENTLLLLLAVSLCRIYLKIRMLCGPLWGETEFRFSIH